MARRRVVIDTDPGVDDAIAILLALASPEIEVVGITTVAGNSPVSDTARNARRLLTLAGRFDVPVARGAATPLVPVEYAHGEVHGADGLGDLTWDEPTVQLDERDAVTLLHELIEAGPLTIVAIGPLTNLAHLRQRHPGDDERVEELVIMGGASFEGNITPAAEFNIWYDPEAAAEVVAGAWTITLMPLDVTHQAYLNDDDLATMRSWGTEVGRRCADMLEPYAKFHEIWYGNRNVIMHDALAVYEILVPEAITKQGAKIAVEVEGAHARGATFIDRRLAHAEADSKVGVVVDNDRFRAFLLERLATLR